MNTFSLVSPLRFVLGSPHSSDCIITFLCIFISLSLSLSHSYLSFIISVFVICSFSTSKPIGLCHIFIFFVLDEAMEHIYSFLFLIFGIESVSPPFQPLCFFFGCDHHMGRRPCLCIYDITQKRVAASYQHLGNVRTANEPT